VVEAVILRGVALILLSLLITFGAVMVTITRPTPVFHDSTRIQLTDDTAADLDPVFSPDGKRIAFSSNRSGTFDIWVMDTDARRRMQLTSMNSDERSPKWSTDGKKIAFLATQQGRTELWIVNIGGEGSVNLTNDGGSKNNFEWNPAGQSLVYDVESGGVWRVWVADLRAHRAVQLTEGQADDEYPSWTSDGLAILFCSNRSGPFKIWEMSSDGFRLSQLTRGNGTDLKPRMSPDGRHIAFVSDRRGSETLWIMDADGTNMHEARSNPPIQRPGLVYLPPAVALGSYPYWNSKSQAVMYYARGFQGANYSNTFVFYQNISVVAYLNWENANPSSPWYQANYQCMGDSLVEMGSTRANVIFASWRPDGKAIVYTSNIHENLDIWVQMLGAETPSPYG
jgi:Tol biopolymer transport system component